MTPRTELAQPVLYSMETKIYLAGGMSQSNWQRKVIDSLSDKKYTFFNPRLHNLNDPREYTLWDLHHVSKCDLLFAYMQRENPSGYGLSLEIGFATGMNIPVILVDERSKIDEDFSKYFKFIRESSSIVFDNFEQGLELLKNFDNGVIS